MAEVFVGYVVGFDGDAHGVLPGVAAIALDSEAVVICVLISIIERRMEQNSTAPSNGQMQRMTPESSGRA